jgi:hypothetical protein
MYDNVADAVIKAGVHADLVKVEDPVRSSPWECL